MDEIVVALDEAAELELHTIDVGISGESIAFSVEGVIRDVDESVLDAAESRSLTPTEIRFAVDDG